jgi:hypothetical protein
MAMAQACSFQQLPAQDTSSGIGPMALAPPSPRTLPASYWRQTIPLPPSSTKSRSPPRSPRKQGNGCQAVGLACSCGLAVAGFSPSTMAGYIPLEARIPPFGWQPRTANGIGHPKMPTLGFSVMRPVLGSIIPRWIPARPPPVFSTPPKENGLQFPLRDYPNHRIKDFCMQAVKLSLSNGQDYFSYYPKDPRLPKPCF